MSTTQRYVAAASVTAAVGFGVIGALLSRQLTAPPGPRAFRTRVHSFNTEDRAVVLSRDSYTDQPGTFGLFLDNGQHIAVGDITDAGSHSVSRRIEHADARKLEGVRAAAWSGIVNTDPSAAGYDVQDVTIQTPAGRAAAWLFAAGSDVWAIHVHGMGGFRASTLRGVNLTRKLGLTSLAVDYRNTSEGPVHGYRRSSLGAAESEDVEAAIDYALSHGAERIVLFGWSMGGAISLQVAAGRHRFVIAGAVLDSPVIDWRRAIRAELRIRRLPEALALTVEPWLAIPALSNLIRVPQTGGLSRFDWTRKADSIPVPLLILHGRHDISVPQDGARRIAVARPDIVTLRMLDGGHTTLWNTAPGQWEQAVEAWLADHNLLPR